MRSLSRVNMPAPSNLDPQLFLEEYPTELLDYLKVSWGTKQMKDIQVSSSPSSFFFRSFF